MHILDHDAPGLADSAMSLPPEQRCRLLAQACDLASRDVPGIAPRARVLLATGCDKGALSPDELNEVQDLATDADGRYLAMVEAGVPEIEWTAAFREARLLTGARHAFGYEEGSAADAIYEFSHAARDQAGFLAAVRSAIATACGA